MNDGQGDFKAMSIGQAQMNWEGGNIVTLAIACTRPLWPRKADAGKRRIPGDSSVINRVHRVLLPHIFWVTAGGAAALQRFQQNSGHVIAARSSHGPP